MMRKAILVSDRANASFESARNAHLLMGLQLWNADYHITGQDPPAD
jgi:hypothetical protein